MTLLASIPGYHAALLADPLTDAIESVISTPYATGGSVSTGALQYAIDLACDPTPFASEKLQAPIAKMVAVFTAHAVAGDQPSTTGVAAHSPMPDPTWEQYLVEIIGQAEANLATNPDDEVAIYDKLTAALQSSAPQPISTASAIDATLAATAPHTNTRAVRQERDDHTSATTLHHGHSSVGPFLDQETIDDVLARPDDYFGDGATVPDRGGFLVELWIDPSGWNEGHDTVNAPILVAYVATALDADDVMTAIASTPHSHAWTGFEARMRVAPSTARQRSVADVVSEWATWINGPGPTYLIP